MKTVLMKLCVLLSVGVSVSLAGCEGVKEVTIYNHSTRPVLISAPYYPANTHVVCINPADRFDWKTGIDDDELLLTIDGAVHGYRLTNRRQLNRDYYREGLNSMRLTLQIEDGRVYIVKAGESLPLTPRKLNNESLLLSPKSDAYVRDQAWHLL